MQEAPTGDHQANGEIEVMVRELKRTIRALKSSTEEKLRVKLRDTDPLLAWIPRHAAFLVSRFRVGEDGKTPYERATGKRWRRPQVLFGERLFFRPVKTTSRKNDFESKVAVGCYVGTRGRNADVVVMAEEGVVKGARIHRKPEPDRWDNAALFKF